MKRHLDEEEEVEEKWESIDEAKFIISKKKDFFRKQIRSKKQHDAFFKKRFQLLSTDEGESKKDNELNSENAMKSIVYEMINKRENVVEYLQKVCSEIKSEYLHSEIDTTQMHDKLKMLRIYSLKVDEFPFIGECLIECGVLSVLIEIVQLRLLNVKQLQLECGYIISNLTHCDSDLIITILRNHFNIIDVLILMFNDSDYSLFTHGMYALANMAQDIIDVRDEALKRGVAVTLLEKYELYKSNNSFIEQTLWFIAIFSIHPHPYELMKGFLGILDQQLAIQNAQSDNTRFILMALKELSDGDSEKIKAILQLKNIKSLLSLTTRGTDKVPLLAYQIIANLTFGSPDQIETLLDLNVLDLLSYGFEKQMKKIKIEVCQTINNLMCQNPNIIERIQKHRYLLPKIFTYVQTGSFVEKKELILALGNFCNNCEYSQIEIMRSRGLLNIMLDSFQLEDLEIINSSLKAIQALLALGNEQSAQQGYQNGNELLMQLESIGLSKVILTLQTHPNKSVYTKVQQIITQYYEY